MNSILPEWVSVRKLQPADLATWLTQRAPNAKTSAAYAAARKSATS